MTSKDIEDIIEWLNDAEPPCHNNEYQFYEIRMRPDLYPILKEILNSTLIAAKDDIQKKDSPGDLIEQLKNL